DGCHGGSKNPSTVISIVSDSTKIFTNKTYTFRVTVRSTSGTQSTAGFDLTVKRDTLKNIPGAGTKRSGTRELTHSAIKTLDNDSTSWLFTFSTSATVGPDTIWVAGNAGNGNDRSTGEQWNTFIYPFVVERAPAAAPEIISRSSLRIV